jgi:hypothetical protein
LIDTTAFQFGRARAEKRIGAVTLSRIAPNIPEAPKVWDHTKGFNGFHMLGNGPDPTLTVNGGKPVGDCGFAMTVNASCVDALETDEPFTMPDSNLVVKTYLKYDHQRDVGVVNSQLFAHWRKEGLPWGGKLVDDADVDHHDYDESMAGGNAFGCLAIGIVVWQDMMTATQNEEPWDWTPATDTTPLGGHDVLVISNDELVTWGLRQKFTRAWYEHAVDEASVLITAAQLAAKGNGYGIDEEKLLAYVASLG